jgi:hypothetical protein
MSSLESLPLIAGMEAHRPPSARSATVAASLRRPRVILVPLPLIVDERGIQVTHARTVILPTCLLLLRSETVIPAPLPSPLGFFLLRSPAHVPPSRRDLLTGTATRLPFLTPTLKIGY